MSFDAGITNNVCVKPFNSPIVCLLCDKERENSFTFMFLNFFIYIYIYIIEKNIIYGIISYYLKRRLFNESKK